MRIILRDLSYRYNGEAGVTNLSLQVESGELFGLLGPSGCGKTTTLRLLAGFIQPEHGHVFFGDEDITGKRPEQLNVGMVFQSYALFPHMTV
ncbi:MAG TPA: ATP-binding cassette domain-containing protein, partial [Candidatus Latescibacteria bacterium]|nr:ATP-binding cassette domain-containing protein [Candidatus Latescibacterota bacterium]